MPSCSTISSYWPHLERGIATAVGAVVFLRPQDTTACKNGVWTATVDFGNDPEPTESVG